MSRSTYLVPDDDDGRDVDGAAAAARAEALRYEDTQQARMIERQDRGAEHG